MTTPFSPILRKLLDDGWQEIRYGAFVHLIGPILTRREGEALKFCFAVEDKHDNTYGRAHGGMILAFCDEAMGLTAHAARAGDKLVTLSFDCQFVGGALPGDVVTIQAEVVRNTTSLIFLRAVCTTGDRPVASCTGIWKAVRNGTSKAER